MNKVVKDESSKTIDSDTQKHIGYIAGNTANLSKGSDIQKHIRHIARNTPSTPKSLFHKKPTTENITTISDFIGKNVKKMSFESKKFLVNKILVQRPSVKKFGSFESRGSKKSIPNLGWSNPMGPRQSQFNLEVDLSPQNSHPFARNLSAGQKFTDAENGLKNLLFIDRTDNFSFEKLEKKYKGKLGESFATRDSRAEKVTYGAKEPMAVPLSSLLSLTPMI
jgi:hypothetical protein